MEKQKLNVSRTELYNQVWAQPISKLAVAYDVSGSYLARICRELNVPTTGRGYWAQLKAGQKLKQVALPPARRGDPNTWIRSSTSSIHTDARPKPPEVRSEIPPQRRSRTPHDFLLQSKQIFLGAKPSYFSSIYLCPRRRKLADLLTSQDHLEKSIAVAQKLFSRLEDYGYRVVLTNGEGFFSKPAVETAEILEKAKHDPYSHNPWRPDPCTVAYFGTVAIGVTIVEMTEVVKTSEWISATKVASGRYRIYAYSPYRYTKLVKNWQDAKGSMMTARFDSIIAEMEALARQIPDLIIEGEKSAAEERAKIEAAHREAQRKRAFEARQQAEKESRSSLKELITAWANWRSQQAFLDELTHALEGLEPKVREELAGRINSAKSLLGTRSVVDLVRSWETPEEKYASLPSWMRCDVVDGVK